MFYNYQVRLWYCFPISGQWKTWLIQFRLWYNYVENQWLLSTWESKCSIRRGFPWHRMRIPKWPTGSWHLFRIPICLTGYWQQWGF